MKQLDFKTFSTGRIDGVKVVSGSPKSALGRRIVRVTGTKSIAMINAWTGEKICDADLAILDKGGSYENA